MSRAILASQSMMASPQFLSEAECITAMEVDILYITHQIKNINKMPLADTSSFSHKCTRISRYFRTTSTKPLHLFTLSAFVNIGRKKRSKWMCGEGII